MELSSEALDEITIQLRKQRTAQGDLRHGSRVGLLASVRILPAMADAEPFPAMLHDIAAGGISFVDMDAMPVGEEFTLVLPMADGKSMELACIVRHCRKAADEMFIIGAAFVARAKAAATKAA